MRQYYFYLDCINIMKKKSKGEGWTQIGEVSYKTKDIN